MESSAKAEAPPIAPPAISDEIYFCGDHETVTVHRRDIPEEKRMAIRRLHAIDKRWNWVVALHWGIFVAAGIIAVNVPFLPVRLLCYALGGLSLSTLSVLSHESSHNLFTHNPTVDRWLGVLCGLPVLFGATAYRVMHARHHKYVRGEGDPDNIENVSPEPWVLRLVYVFIFLVGTYEYIFAVPIQALKFGTAAERRAVVGEFVGNLALIVGCWFVLPSSWMLHAWLFPTLFAAQISNVRGIAEHGMTSRGNEFTDTRTVATHAAIGWMMCHINYHLEHHLFPGVPWYNLPKVHAMLLPEFHAAGSPVHSSYSRFLWDVAKALATGVVPSRRLISREFRDEICMK